jgi:Ion channel
LKGLNNIVANSTKFYQCELSNFNAFSSRFYSINFYHCKILKAYFEKSSIFNMIIEDCSFDSFSFNRVEVKNIVYVPPKKEYHCAVAMTYETVADNYKRFRVLYQANGLRREASEAYYKERLYEMKSNWAKLELMKSISYLWKRDFAFSFTSIMYNTKQLIKSISDFISYFIWGFGERPIKILLSSFIALLIYALVYFFSSIDKLNHDIVNSCYLSIVTFTTLGFGDITPMNSNSYKLIVSSEALIGVFFMGLLVAGYANRSKY